MARPGTGPCATLRTAPEDDMAVPSTPNGRTAIRIARDILPRAQTPSPAERVCASAWQCILLCL
eukprot:scaffold61681_cov75-Phaeocystis_antarctica.AAC.3